jgi:hypothetical protein
LFFRNLEAFLLAVFLLFIFGASSSSSSQIPDSSFVLHPFSQARASPLAPQTNYYVMGCGASSGGGSGAAFTIEGPSAVAKVDAIGDNSCGPDSDEPLRQLSPHQQQQKRIAAKPVPPPPPGAVPLMMHGL